MPRLLSNYLALLGDFFVAVRAEIVEFESFSVSLGTQSDHLRARSLPVRKPWKKVYI